MLLDKASSMMSVVNLVEFAIEDLENPEDTNTPSAWNIRCYQEGFENEIIRRDLFHRLSSEAKEVLHIFIDTPAEVTKALLDICVGGERGNPREYCRKKSIQYIYKPARVKNYLRRMRNMSREKIEMVFKELILYFKESAI